MTKSLHSSESKPGSILLPGFFKCALILTLTLSGCVTIAQHRAMEQDLVSMQAQLEVLRQRMESRSGSDNEASHTSGRNVADLSASFEQLRADMAKLSGQVEESQHNLQDEKQATQKMFQDMDQRLQELEKRIENSASRPAVAPPVEREPERASSPAPAKKRADPEEEQYQHAIAPLRKGEKPSAEDLKDAEARLKTFIKEHPKSRYKANVHFWMGEVYYGQADYKRAIVEFEKVAETDPKNEKVAGARLKQGFCFLALKKNDTAKLFFQQVVEQFPQSQESQIAKKKLDDLK